MYQRRLSVVLCMFCVVLVALLAERAADARAVMFTWPDPPIAAVVGSRYIEITPTPWASDVALQVIGLWGSDPFNSFDDPNVLCVGAFVQADGTLGPNAFYQSVEDWGTVYAHGPEIIPDATYTVRTCDAVTGCGAAVWILHMNIWGDTDSNGVVNILDVDRVVDGFQGLLTDPRDFFAADVIGTGVCDVEGVINIMDIVAVLDAFQGDPFPCPDPCPVPPGPGPRPRAELE